MNAPSMSAEVPDTTGGSLSEVGRSFVAAADSLGAAPSATVLRAWCVSLLFDGSEKVFASRAEPTQAISQLFLDLTESLRVIRTTGLCDLGAASAAFRTGFDVRAETGEHYGRLFQAFSTSAYWDEPLRLLRERLDRNGISLPGLAKARVLDAGCGGGRYTAAWRQLGARRVVGVDASTVGVINAASRVRRADLDGVEFQQADVLALPFADSSFDVVFSNGVLHHTTNWAVGVSEVVRVLRAGGFGWLYVIERPGGLFWDVIDILRMGLRNDRHDAARAALTQLGLPANRIFYMLDHVMVPINVRLTPDEVEDRLRRCGAMNIRRLMRGTSFDRVERLAQEDAFAEVKYGVGENRYIFTKP